MACVPRLHEFPCKIWLPPEFNFTESCEDLFPPSLPHSLLPLSFFLPSAALYFLAQVSVHNAKTLHLSFLGV